MIRANAAKGLSLNEMRNRVARFVVDYKDATSEKSDAQNFWRDLMACYGVDSVRRKGVIFEHQAKRADTGNYGYIDVFKPKLFLIEHKSAGKLVTPKGAAMSNAEQQANAYIAGGSISGVMPRYVLTSDFTSIQVTDLDKRKGDPTRTLTVRTADLTDYVESFLFLTAEEDIEAIIREDQAVASVKAARIMGELFTALTKDADTDDEDDPTDQDEETFDASILLTRLLFLMFGDDAGLWPRATFHRFVLERTQTDGSDMAGQLTMLFDVLDTPEKTRDRRIDEAFARFPYVNGALFRRGVIKKMPWFDQEMRDALLNACEFDWSRISPAVFGSLFQTVHSKEARDAGGEHYTSEENILKTLQPLFLDDLRRRLDAANTKPQLEALHEEFKHFRYVDPACGCGNFLIVAYREMRQLELDLLMKLKTKQGDTQLILDPSDLLNVTLDQFTGIEIKWWPAKIAETAMFLVDHQANSRMAKTLGVTPNRLPIDIAANIHHKNALTIDWDELLPNGPTVWVFGNPPFLGRKETSEEQKAELSVVWKKPTAHLDYVTAWHRKALDYFEDVEGEFAFVSSNSVTQGEQVPDLFPDIEGAGWRIKFGHRTFYWINESTSKERAHVHCVIVGFTRQASAKQRLFNYPDRRTQAEVRVTEGINGYLADAPAVYPTSRSRPLSPELAPVNFGSMPRDDGYLLIEAEDYAEVTADKVAAKYVRKFIGARQLINNEPRWCLWMVDLDPADVPKSVVLKERLQGVREMRSKSKADTTREWAKLPHLFVQQAQPTVPYICIPRHFSESRMYATVARFGPDVIAGDSCFTTIDPDGFVFAVLSSSMFMVWQKTVGGRLKSDPRFSKEIVWNTLPLPAATPASRAAIINAGAGVIAARNLRPDRSLADLYQPLAMSKELVAAHNALDKVVDKAFGAGRARMDELSRQTVAFDRYAEMTAALP